MKIFNYEIIFRKVQQEYVFMKVHYKNLEKDEKIIRIEKFPKEWEGKDYRKYLKEHNDIYFIESVQSTEKVQKHYTHSSFASSVQMTVK